MVFSPEGRYVITEATVREERDACLSVIDKGRLLVPEPE
jgi:hypothetical protein